LIKFYLISDALHINRKVDEDIYGIDVDIFQIVLKANYLNHACKGKKEYNSAL